MTVLWGAPSSEAHRCQAQPPVSQRRKQKAREEMACPQATAGGGRAALVQVSSPGLELPRGGGSGPSLLLGSIWDQLLFLLQG